MAPDRVLFSFISKVKKSPGTTKVLGVVLCLLKFGLHLLFVVILEQVDALADSLGNGYAHQT